MLNDNDNSVPPMGFQLRRMLHGSSSPINRLAWSPDGQMLASASMGGEEIIWNTETGDTLQILKGYTQSWDVAWLCNAQLLAFPFSLYVDIWEVNTSPIELFQTLKGHKGLVYAIACSPDGWKLVAGGEDGNIRLWFPKTLKAPQIFKGNASPVLDIAWSPDGRWIASGHADSNIRIWDTETGELRSVFEGHKKSVYTVTWSPDGRWIASGSGDSTIHIWNIASGKPMRTLEGHTNAITCIDISSDGRLLASKCSDNTVRLWDCGRWITVAILSEPASEARFQGLAFHPTKPFLATLTSNGTKIRIWELNLDIILSITTAEVQPHYTSAKIALVGDSGVGKTGLGWRLAHGDFREQASTHGQQFWVLGELGTTRADGTECEAVLWDFAGQPDYRLVHALFLDDVDLALVLFDPANRQEPLKGIEYWLKQLLRRKGQQRHTILVGARADRGTSTLSSEELNEFCIQHGIDGGYVSTSALTGEGLGELLRSVKSLVDWDAMTATVTTDTFKRIKEFVLKLKEDNTRKGVLVSPADLRIRLQESDLSWEFTDAEMVTAVKHLATHGYVSILRSSSGKETILLVPDLIANLAASLVLEARRNPKGLGALDEAWVLRGEYRFPELNELEKHEQDVLLDSVLGLLIEHNLCFRETLGEQTLIIFPALINQKRPLLENIEIVEDVLFHVSGAVENVYAALVVLLGYTNTFSRTNQWQNQAQYETAHGDVCGFMQVDEREGRIELLLYYSKEGTRARSLFQGLFEEFLRGRDVTVIKYPPVACPRCGYKQPRSEVVKRINEKKGFLFCGECSGEIVLPKTSEIVSLNSSDREKLNQESARTKRRTAFETGLVRVKAIVRDSNKVIPSCFISYAWGDAEQEHWASDLVTDLQNAGIEVIFDQHDNAQVGSDVARFISRIEQADFIIVIGTPEYKKKYENRLSSSGSIVAAEVNLIHLRLTSTNEDATTVLPLILKGDAKESLPPLMQGKVYASFTREEEYFASLFDLILTLFRIPFHQPIIKEQREILRGNSERF